jgi:hypothetical protein
VQERTEEQAGKGGSVTLNHVIKNNGCELDGLVIMEKGKNVAPTIYLNSYYEQYMEGKNLDDIVGEILHIYTIHKDTIRIDTDNFGDFEKMKNCILYKVVNYEKNKKLLESVPHKKILDLAVVYYCLLGQFGDESATALIYNRHLENWKISEEELYKSALENTPQMLESRIYPMSSIINKMCGEEEEVNIAGPMDMYVLTNKCRLNGAACMLYEDVLRDFSVALGVDLYILPSSVHEVILLPMLDNYEREELEKMVCEVNAESVSKEELLSEHVYTFYRKDGFLSM